MVIYWEESPFGKCCGHVVAAAQFALHNWKPSMPACLNAPANLFFAQPLRWLFDAIELAVPHLSRFDLSISRSDFGIFDRAYRRHGPNDAEYWGLGLRVVVSRMPSRSRMPSISELVCSTAYSIANAFGYDFSLMTAARAEGNFYDGPTPHPWHAFGYIRTSPAEQQFWGFGLHLLVSHLQVNSQV